MGFTLTLTLGAALLATWLDVRLAALRPKTPTQSLTHALISVLALVGSAGLLGLIYGIRRSRFSQSFWLCSCRRSSTHYSPAGG